VYGKYIDLKELQEVAEVKDIEEMVVSDVKSN